MLLNITATNLSNEFKEVRFSNGEICMYCGSTHVVKHGKLNSENWLIYGVASFADTRIIKFRERKPIFNI